MTETFTCENCGETFTKERSDEQAMTEAVEHFGSLLEDGGAVVCSDCYAKIIAWAEHPDAN